MQILLLSMPDSFEHTPTVAVRMPNGALASLAGNLDPHHRVAIADLVLAQRSVRRTVEELVRDLQPELVGHERVERLGLEHEREERFAARLVDADGEQVLRGDVGVHHAQVRIEHHDAGGESADEVGGLEVGDCGREKPFNRHAGPRPCRQ